MKRVGSFLGDWWRLCVPYFKSEERWLAITLLVGAIVLTLSSVGAEVAYNEWSRRFFDTFQNKDEPAFWQEMINFSWIAALLIAFALARALVSPYLRLRWRRWLTRQYLAHWLDSRGYYRIELERKIDNADQRIAEDINRLGLYTMQLLLGLIGAVATLVSFLIILWTLSGAVSLAFIGIDATVPGYMVWVALVYALVGTWLANLVGRRLIPLNFAQQALEADFRFALVRVRENAEGIALYQGEPAEQENLVARFQAVFMNGWRVLFVSLQLTFYQSGYAQIAIIFPYLVTGPRFFAGAITLGVMTQTAQAFGQVQSALSFFIDNYSTVAELRAVMDRLNGLKSSIDHKQDTAVDVAAEAGRTDVAALDLTLGLPNGQALLRDAQLILPKGRSTLITGASGSGKSTLFRALAGIWPFGHGHVRVPAGARVLFLPQKPYIPIGTLRDAVKYPDEHSKASDAEVVAALEAARLGHLTPRLNDTAHWTYVLSGG
ncbi:ABC transporter ATP-binding protein/permease [soil metagenome]